MANVEKSRLAQFDRNILNILITEFQGLYRKGKTSRFNRVLPSAYFENENYESNGNRHISLTSNLF